ncbi:MAG: GNAT family N-acetyltransferase [Anaerolineales bacterium]
MTPTIQVTLSPTADDIRLIEQGLLNYNRQFVEVDGYQRLAVILRDEHQTLVGGLLGDVYWNWLHISVLWLDESVRRQGYGSQMLKLAEEEAGRQGCHSVNLDTMSFQALEFYQRHGYTIFGVLEDHPIGHTRYFLKKKL